MAKERIHRQPDSDANKEAGTDQPQRISGNTKEHLAGGAVVGSILFLAAPGSAMAADRPNAFQVVDALTTTDTTFMVRSSQLQCSIDKLTKVRVTKKPRAGSRVVEIVITQADEMTEVDAFGVDCDIFNKETDTATLTKRPKKGARFVRAGTPQTLPRQDDYEILSAGDSGTPTKREIRLKLSRPATASQIRQKSFGVRLTREKKAQEPAFGNTGAVLSEVYLFPTKGQSVNLSNPRQVKLSSYPKDDNFVGNPDYYP